MVIFKYSYIFQTETVVSVIVGISYLSLWYNTLYEPFLSLHRDEEMSYMNDYLWPETLFRGFKSASNVEIVPEVYSSIQWTFAKPF